MSRLLIVAAAIALAAAVATGFGWIDGGDFHHALGELALGDLLVTVAMIAPPAVR